MTNFTLTTPNLEPERIGKALNKIIPLSTIEKAISQTNSEQKRDRVLPTNIIILLSTYTKLIVHFLNVIN